MADTSPEHNIITNTEGYIYRNINRTRGSDNIINAQELTSIQTQGRSLQRHRTARICRRDVIRQHRNLSNDIIKGTLVVLPLSHPSEEPCLLSLRVYVSCNRLQLWILNLVVFPTSRFVPFSLNHLEPFPLWYQRLVKVRIFRATFQDSFDISSYVESQRFHETFSFDFACFVISHPEISRPLHAFISLRRSETSFFYQLEYAYFSIHCFHMCVCKDKTMYPHF